MLQRIVNWALGKQDTEILEKKDETDNVVDSQKKLVEAIIAFFKPFFGQKKFSDRVVVWVDNRQQVYQSLIRNKDFDKDLRIELENKQLYAISKAEFTYKTDCPPPDLQLREIIDGVYIQLIAVEAKKKMIVPSKAKVSISNGKGSLMKAYYILDANTLTEYHIGRGEDNSNDIVIKEDDQDWAEINNRVSRQHAKIVHIAENGFYLQSRNVSNRTIIYRNNKRVADLKEEISKSLLQHNDEIELGKSFRLLFEIIE